MGLKYKLQDGISELIEKYKMIVPQESSHYRNSFPLSYGDPATTTYVRHIKSIFIYRNKTSKTRFLHLDIY